MLTVIVIERNGLNIIHYYRGINQHWLLSNDDCTDWLTKVELLKMKLVFFESVVFILVDEYEKRSSL
jgi:hypothetical protein